MQMKTYGLASLLVVAAGCSPDATKPTEDLPLTAATSALPGTWTTRAAYPTWITQTATASITSALKSTLYVIGGQPKQFGSAGTVSDVVRAYAVSANTWTRKAPYPIRVQNTNGAVEINGKIYVTGGHTRRWDEKYGVWRLTSTRAAYAYTPATNHWARLADVPWYSSHGVSDAYKGFLYVVTYCENAGFCPDAPQGVMYRYNPANNNWVLLTITPHDNFATSGGIIGGKFYLVAPSGEMDVYDITTNTWSTGPQRPDTRYCQPASLSFMAKLYLAGCRADFATGPVPLQVYDPKSGWSYAAAPPVDTYGRLSLSRVVVNGSARLQLVGGDVPDNNLRFTP